MHKKKKFMMLFYYASVLGLTACGLKGGSSTHIQEETTLLPEIGNENKDIEKNISILKVEDPKDVIFIHEDNNLQRGTYLAKGDGGLGDDFDEKNSLTSYDGIPVKLKNQSFSVNISSTDNNLCKSIFYFDKETSKIKIKNQVIKSFVQCNIEITAVDPRTNNSIRDIKKLTINLSPTFYLYAKNDDPLFLYLKTYSSLRDIRLIIKWLKDLDAHPEGLNLSYHRANFEDLPKLENVNALVGFQSLKSLNLANSNILDLTSLSQMKGLRSLNLSHLSIKNNSFLNINSEIKYLDLSYTDIRSISEITRSCKNLISLNISGNRDIKDLEYIKSLKKINELYLSDVGIKNIDIINEITTLKKLDISHNEFRDVKKDFNLVLNNLYNLKSLNISYSHVPDSIINSYFSEQRVIEQLEEFKDANDYNPNIIISKDNCFKNISNFDLIPNLFSAKNLVSLDIHGNSCRVGKNEWIGLRDTKMFSAQYLPSLQYLNISGNAIQNIEELAFFQLKELELIRHLRKDSDTYFEVVGIELTRDACFNQLKNKSFNRECKFLSTGQGKSQEFLLPGEFQFIVPNNVYSISISACSGGDGGQGGQGGQGGFSGGINHAVQVRYIDGWKEYGGGGDFGTLYYFTATEIPPPGSMGTLGTVSGVPGKLMSDQLPESQGFNGYCQGGSGGKGGASGGINNGPWGQQSFNPPPYPINGSNGADGISKKMTILRGIHVTPGQELQVIVGRAGIAGIGTGPVKNGYCPWESEGKEYRAGIHCAYNGRRGDNGQNGTSGYVRIDWFNL